MAIRVVVEKVSGMGGLHFAGKGGGEASSSANHWTRSYMGELPHEKEFIAFGDDFPNQSTQVIRRPPEVSENYGKPDTIIAPETAWCRCRESLGPQHGEDVIRIEKWENGILEC